MKPSKVELNGDKSSVLVVPDHELGIFVVSEARGMRVESMLGRSAFVAEVALEDARIIEAGDFSALAKYIRHTTSETGLIVAESDRVWLRRERDGSGLMSGHDRIKYMEEYSPNPGASAKANE